MKVMIDTNIFISAALFPNGTTSSALKKALLPPYTSLTCDYVIDELKRKFREKFPDKTEALNEFLKIALPVIEIVQTPDEKVDEESKIRDPKDRPILRAALSSDVDLFLTGDKDFLESGINHPKIMTAAEFMAM